MKYLDLAIANETIKTTNIKGKEYAEVNQRIKAFRMLYPKGSIKTEMLSNENGVCIFRAMILDDDFNVLGTGTAYEKEDSSFINQTSYIENCETSAVGRALGMCGFGIDTSVASYEEVANAIENQVITQEQADTYTLKFGKYKGKTIKEVYQTDSKYIEWVINNTEDSSLLKVISMATGIVIPTEEEVNRKSELILKIKHLADIDKLDIDDIKDNYDIKSLTELDIEQLEEIVNEYWYRTIRGNK